MAALADITVDTVSIENDIVFPGSGTGISVSRTVKVQGNCGASLCTLDGGGTSRLFDLGSGSAVTFRELTFYQVRACGGSPGPNVGVLPFTGGAVPLLLPHGRFVCCL